jgi:hypothetical protein
MRRIPTMDASVRFDDFFGLRRYFADIQPLVENEAGTLAEFLEFAEQEERADLLRFFQPVYIPGLFQLEEYARELVSGTRPDRVEQLISTRMGRQEILTRENPPSIVAVVAERTIREVIGGAGVMRRQLARLLELANEPNIDIQLLPSSARVHVSTEFHLLGYAEGGDLAYVEGAADHGRVIEDSRGILALEVIFDRVRSSALTAEDTQQVIRNAMESL